MSSCTTLTSNTFGADTIVPRSLRYGAPGRIAAFAEWAASTFHQLRKVRCYRRAERQLDAMSDRLLTDIGISRAQIHHAVRFGRLARDGN